MKANIPEPASLRKMISYSPETGLLVWLERPVDMFLGQKRRPEQQARAWNTRMAGKPAFAGVDRDGYLYGAINGKAYLAHRVAWAMHYGKWPDGEVDHINGNRADNRIENLRVVPRAQNMRNRRARYEYPYGFGVYRTPTGRWNAAIKVNHKSIGLGGYATIEEAISARQIAENKYGFI